MSLGVHRRQVHNPIFECNALVCREEDLCYCGFDRQSHSEEARAEGIRDPFGDWTQDLVSDVNAVPRREALGTLPSRSGLRPVHVRATLGYLQFSIVFSESQSQLVPMFMLIHLHTVREDRTESLEGRAARAAL